MRDSRHQTYQNNVWTHRRTWLELCLYFIWFGFTEHRKGNTRFPATPPCCNRVLWSFMFAFHCVLVLCGGAFPKYVSNRTPGVSKSRNKRFMFPALCSCLCFSESFPKCVFDRTPNVSKVETNSYLGTHFRCSFETRLRNSTGANSGSRAHLFPPFWFAFVFLLTRRYSVKARS